jgi:hypothetical protein
VPRDDDHVFQRLAKTWEAVHPYNAGQACRVARASRAWPGPGVLHRLAPEEDLSRHFTREMNRPFGNDEAPFRPFVQTTADGTWFGVVYRHRVADSFSIRQLMRAWLDPGYTPNFQSARRSNNPSPNLMSLIRRYGDYRRVRKVHTMGPLDYSVRVKLLEKLVVSVPALLDYARSRGVKLNDVLVAAVAEACARFVPAQCRANRHDIAISSVVDLRNQRERDFGCYLGFTSAICRPRNLPDWDKLLRRVANEHAGQRSDPGVLWMRAAELATRFTPPHRLYDFYRKEAPFAAGISNINLGGTWFDENVLDYVRVSPTGPMVPLALNVTSHGGNFNASITYRTALFNDWTILEIVEAFQRRLASLV